MSDMIEVIDILNGDYTIVRHEDGCDLYRSKALPIAFKISVSEACQLAERDQNNRSNMHLSEDGVAHILKDIELLERLMEVQHRPFLRKEVQRIAEEL